MGKGGGEGVGGSVQLIVQVFPHLYTTPSQHDG